MYNVDGLANAMPEHRLHDLFLAKLESAGIYLDNFISFGRERDLALFIDADRHVRCLGDELAKRYIQREGVDWGQVSKKGIGR